jgi:hypothetical protein
MLLFSRLPQTIRLSAATRSIAQTQIGSCCPIIMPAGPERGSYSNIASRRFRVTGKPEANFPIVDHPSTWFASVVQYFASRS